MLGSCSSVVDVNVYAAQALKVEILRLSLNSGWFSKQCANNCGSQKHMTNRTLTTNSTHMCDCMLRLVFTPAAFLMFVSKFFLKFLHVKNHVYQLNMQKNYQINIFDYGGHNPWYNDTHNDFWNTMQLKFSQLRFSASFHWTCFQCWSAQGWDVKNENKVRVNRHKRNASKSWCSVNNFLSLSYFYFRPQ